MFSCELIRTGVLALVVVSVAAGCAGGNAIDRGVPQAAFIDDSAPFPPPAQPPDAITTPATANEAASAPAPSGTEAAEVPEDPLFTGSGQASTTGNYPNINATPHGATSQLSDSQAAALKDQMAALAKAQDEGRVSPAQYSRRLAELRRLAATRSEEVIKQIEQ
jgi:hypothetical protein